ncbi:F-box protein At3g07870-like [Cucumis sativus]|uniref:F-box protein At3g07870-like n=1 Tax=Cucumis sativus TaxID=3659 RepID=UPI0012F479E7|nr:F-box protein At3g07870-like [Cucumis sativus]
MTWGEGLPTDIAISIFSKLIISHLRVCRLVCKTWNAMVLDYAHSCKLNNDFLLSVSDVVPNPRSSWLCNARMYCFRSDPTKRLDVYLDFFELEGSKSAFSVPSVDDGDWFRVTLICYCNGLLFVCKSKLNTMCHGIFNPTTNEFYHVPEVFYDIYHFGLGYIPSTKQYKLFRLAHSKTQQEPITIIDVFHFGRNQWRQLHSLPYIIEGGGIYMDGVIYFLVKVKNKPNDYAIYALDVETEEIELSAILEVGPGLISSSRSQILQSYGNVYVIIFIKLPTTTNSSVQVWRMQEKTQTQRKCLMGICQIETLNFGLLRNILACDEKENQNQGDR